MFQFFIFFPHWNGTVSWNPYLQDNAMTIDDLVMLQGQGFSSDSIDLDYLSRNILVLGPERLSKYLSLNG